MKNTPILFRLLPVFMLISSGNVHAQPDSLKRTWDLSIHAGTTISYTDISANQFGRDQSWAAGISSSKYFNHWFALRGQLLTGKLVGKGSKEGVNTKYSYSSEIHAELSAQALFQFSHLFCHNGVSRVAPYVFLGVGMIHVNPMVYQRGVDGSANFFIDKVNGVKDNTVDYHNLTHLVLPAGLGVKFRLNNRYTVGVESAFRISNTDKLNGYNENPATLDAFAFYSIGLTMHIGKKGEVVQWTGCTVKMDKKHSFDKVSKYGKHADAEVDMNSPVEKIVPETTIEAVQPVVPVTEPSIQSSQVNGVNEVESISITRHRMVFRQNDPLPSVYFNDGSYLVESTALSALDSFAEYLTEFPQARLTLAGIVNSTIQGQAEKSLALIRAEAVKNRLVRMYGISSERLETTTLNSTPSTGARLSRVDVRLNK